MSYLQELTTEQREELREKSRLTKEAKKEAGKDLFQDFGDDLNHWKALASKAGVRLPAYYIPGSETKHIKRLLTKLGADVKEFLEDQGYPTLKKMVSDDPKWPAFAQCGLVLEWWHEKAEKSV